jgi:type VI secretion system protein ImpA
MSTVEELLSPVEGDAPAGANLEYTPAFAELERTAAGRPERQVGAVVSAAEAPDWQSVITQSHALLKSTKDLRVANHLLRASLGVHGFVGLADGLRLLTGLLDRYWADLYPRLDAEDNEDPTFRVNAMAALTHREVLQAIRAAPLLRVRGLGTVSLRDVEAAALSGPPGAPGQAPSAESGAIEAVFQQVPLPELSAAARVVEQCSETARTLAEGWASRLEAAGPDFTELRRILAQASNLLTVRLQERQPVQNGTHAAQDGAGAAIAGAATPSTSALLSGDIRSRDDVVRALDGICAYYSRYEPSSPVPLLLERCKRLVTMSFLDIVKEMLPEGSSTIQTIIGKPKE